MNIDIQINEHLAEDVVCELEQRINALLKVREEAAAIAGENAPSWAPAEERWAEIEPRNVSVEFVNPEVLPLISRGEIERGGSAAKWIAIADPKSIEELSVVRFRVTYEVAAR